MLRALSSVICALACALAASPAYAACDGTPLPSTRASVMIAGHARTFIVRAPAVYDGRKPAPVMFAFHPFGMNADYMASRAPIGRTWRDAIVIFPNGAPQPGSGAAPAWQTTAGENGDRDLHFFDAMLEWVREHACLNEHRVFAMGYSNGAGFAYLLACERGATIAGLAIASGRTGCHPTQPTPVVITHGTRDTTIPFDDALDAAMTWASVNGCSAPPQPIADGCVVAPSCQYAPVTLCTYTGGHEYDSSFTATAINVLRKR